MEHIIVTDLGNGLLRLTPEAGYRLYNDIAQRQYTEAVVKEENVGLFVAVKVAEPSDDDPIGAAEALRIITGR